MKTLLPSLVLIAGITGCAATADLPAAYRLQDKQGEGLAIVSLTLSGKSLDKFSSLEYKVRELVPRAEDEVTARPYYSSTLQHARAVGKETQPRAIRQVALVKGPNSAEALDVIETGKAIGRLAALRLPPGDYEFHAWTAREPNPYGGTEYSPRQAFSYRFSIRPGVASYVGRLNLHLTERETQRLAIADRRDEDLALFRKKYPAVDISRIAFEVGKLAL